MEYLRLLLLLRISKGHLGRRAIASELGIGEGVVRGLLSLARNLNHVEIKRAGVKLTELGEKFINEILYKCNIRNLKIVNKLANKICGNVCTAFLLDKEISDIIRLRDEFVKSGACGALIMRRNGELYIPYFDSTLEQLDLEIAQYLKSDESKSIAVVCGENLGKTLRGLYVICGRRDDGNSDER